LSNSRIEPHGGKICDRMVTEESISKLKQDFIHLQSWTLNDRQICDLEMIMNGGFSPLIGFLDQEDYDAVCTGMRLQNNDLWPIPITLDVTENTAEKLAKKGKLVLRDKEGFALAVMTIGDIWKPDRKKEAEQVYGTIDETHPGVNYLLHESNPIYIGGSVEGVHVPKHYDYQDLRHTPAQLREEFDRMGWSNIVAFQTRNPMHRAHVELTHRASAKANAKSYVEQAKAILDIRSVIIKYNSDWLNKMNFNDVVKLASSYTVARMLERDDFTKRFQAEVPISIHEFLYPLAQAQDSVELRADVELGGTDQKFNLLVGRDLQKDHGQEPQCIITTPLLEGTDGVEKMSKSYGNHIGLQDTPEDMYGKTLSISDDMILKWFTLAADADESVTKSVKKRLVDPAVNPMDVKRDLARAVVALYYDDETATKAEDHFNTVVVGKGIPDDMPEYTLKGEDLIVNVLFDAGLLKSKGEARRMVKQGAVKLDGKPVEEIQKTLTPNGDQILKVGKRRFLKVTG